jgi:sugar/nucleoside kinase (ribokinase family)
MARIVVVGSVARDEVVRLAERLREGAHLQGRPPEPRLGGGGANIAVALALAHHAVALVAAIGDDPLAGELLAELAAAGVDGGAVIRVPGPSTRSLVMVDPAGERTIVNLTRAREPEPPLRLAGLPADCVYVRTRAPGLVPLLAAHAARCPVIAHIPPVEDGLYPVPVLVGSASDLDAAVLADPLAAGRRVAGLHLRWVVVTRGADGAEAFGTRGEHLHVPAPKVEVVDSTGAGDCFAAGLTHGLAQGMDVATALETAVRWGAAKVACAGSTLSREAVVPLLG